MRKSSYSNRVLVIRRSCITGKVVWVYFGPSRAAARQAYSRACKEELRRVRRWEETSAQRKQRILNFLNDCLAEIPITDSLSGRQVEAARIIKSLGKEDVACHREFYQHVVEERRRRREANAIRQQMKERARLKKEQMENSKINNPNYV